ncbi:DUF547 domain-containing protein [Flavobacterium sp. ZT3P35]|uniref:DUF547 domain-containing protein n=2 Tax=unclassified Flavobacterium TaxID=196869 RepID=UPI003AB06A20
MKNYYNTLAEEIFYLANLEIDTSSLRRQFFYINPVKLEKSLDNDNLKKAFWINVYNAFYLIICNELNQNNKIFDLKRIKIAGSVLSLNDIEHGILRKGKFKIGFGHIANPFYSDFIKNLAVSKVDNRICFALRHTNLTAENIEYFDCDLIEEQLTIISKDFIRKETEFDTELKTSKNAAFLVSYLKNLRGKDSVKKLVKTTSGVDLV